MSRIVLRTRKFVVGNVLHANDTPHQIALGVALAMFITFLPIVGIQTFVAVGVAALFRANKAVCIPIVWITNPFTIWPIYGACWVIGHWAVADPGAVGQHEVLAHLQAVDATTTSFFELAYWKGLLDQMLSFGVELWVGCALVGVIFAVISYFFALWGVVRYREKRRQRILRRELLRSHARSEKVSRRSEPV